MAIKKGRIPSLTHERHHTPDVEAEPEPPPPEKPTSKAQQVTPPKDYKLYDPPQYVAVAANKHRLYSLDGEEWFDEDTYYSR